MVLQSHVSQQSVVLLDLSSQILHPGLVLVHLVPDDESLVEFDDLTKSEVLTRRAVQPSSSLNELQERDKRS